jgi:hypothetical protein
MSREDKGAITHRLELRLNSALRGQSYNKSGQSWIRSNDETVSLINLQASQWGAVYYVNLGIVIRSLADVRKPKVSDTHISVRLDRLVPDPVEIARCSDYDCPSVDEDLRMENLVQMVLDYGVKWLDSLSTIDRIREIYRAGALRGDADLAARALLQ